MKRPVVVAALAVALMAAAVVVTRDPHEAAADGARLTSSASASAGIHKIRHVIVIMQENRSFDSYFGTYPGADGFPMRNGKPRVCVPDPLAHRCVRPFHDHHDLNVGGPHGPQNAIGDIDGGKMDGFIREALGGRIRKCLRPGATNPACHAGPPADLMGYHDAREIPNYWAYAHNFVLQDHMFEPTFGWSLPAHLFAVSGWSPKCTNPTEPMSCKSNLEGQGKGPDATRKLFPRGPFYAWTDLTYLLHKHHVS